MKPVTLHPARYEGVLGVLVGVGGFAHVATSLERFSTLWGLGLGSLGLIVMGSLLVLRRIRVSDEGLELTRLVDKHSVLRLRLDEIKRAEYNPKLRVYEVRTATVTHHVRIGRSVAKKLAAALKSAGLKAK
jgi:hypothetical protein